MRLRRVLAAAATVAAVAAIAPSAAADSPSQWRRYYSQPFTVAAGVTCPFAFHGDIVEDKEYVRDLLTYPDGSPEEQEFTGPLTIRYTNLSTGESVDRDLSGTGWWFYDPDGTTHGHGFKHMGLGVHIGNPTSPPGEWIFSGTFDFVLHANGTRDFSIERGSAEDLCQTLA